MKKTLLLLSLLFLLPALSHAQGTCAVAQASITINPNASYQTGAICSYAQNGKARWLIFYNAVTGMVQVQWATNNPARVWSFPIASTFPTVDKDCPLGPCFTLREDGIDSSGNLMIEFRAH